MTAKGVIKRRATYTVDAETVAALHRHRGMPASAQLREDVSAAVELEQGVRVLCCGRIGHPCSTVIREGDRTCPPSHGLCPACYAAEEAEQDALEAAQAAEKGETT